MSDRVSFIVPLPPKELRANSRAQHWAVRRKAADEYSADVYWSIRITVRGPDDIYVWPAHDPNAFPWAAASVTYTWRYVGSCPDLDNCLAGLKVLQDTLCMAPAGGPGRNRWFLGLVENDGGLEPITIKREKVARKADEGVLVEVERREPEYATGTGLDGHRMTESGRKAR